jgi:hypothetical protein
VGRVRKLPIAGVFTSETSLLVVHWLPVRSVIRRNEDFLLLRPGSDEQCWIKNEKKELRKKGDLLSPLKDLRSILTIMLYGWGLPTNL